MAAYRRALLRVVCNSCELRSQLPLERVLMLHGLTGNPTAGLRTMQKDVQSSERTLHLKKNVMINYVSIRFFRTAKMICSMA